MSIFSPGLFVLAGIASMTQAFDKGDVDEASRQGVLAGPAVVEQALASPHRATRLAAIAAAPMVEDRAELLQALATVAASGDRRAAIPAARAARAIAREMAARELPDDLSSDDVATWRDELLQLATNPRRFIEVRVLALDASAALSAVLDLHVGTAALPFDLAALLRDPDPSIRAAAIADLPRPTPGAALAPLANSVKNDADDQVALAAAQALCGDNPTAAQPLLAAQGQGRITKLARGKSARLVRDALRCVAK